MKNFTKTLALGLLLVSFFITKAQDNTLLKSFINKNDVAVRSVQKHAILLANPNSEATFKELLKSQIASVKLYKNNPSKSADIAYAVREKCKAFLNENSKTSTDYLILSDKEKSYFSSHKTINNTDSFLNKSELEKVNNVDAKNPRLFDDLTVRIK